MPFVVRHCGEFTSYSQRLLHPRHRVADGGDSADTKLAPQFLAPGMVVSVAVVVTETGCEVVAKLPRAFLV